MSEICVFRPALTAKKSKKWRISAGLRAFLWSVGRFFGYYLVGKSAEKKSSFGFGAVFLSETRTGCRVAGFFVA